MTNSPSKTLVEPALAYTNVDEVVKRIAADPSVMFGLEDIFPDREYASAFVSLGLGYHLAAYIAAQAAEEARRVFGPTLDHMSWEYFGWFAPIRDLGLDPGLELGPECLTTLLIREHFDPSETPGNYDLGDQVREHELLGVLHAELLYYTFICAQCRAREEGSEPIFKPGLYCWGERRPPLWDDEDPAEGE
ncbi:hypothetical protein GS481_02645 [Rhodococcus hoagii]|nr:hypothetical protein [Prescottella equi]